MNSAYIEEMKKMKFHEYIKQKRKDLGATLRAFCKQKGYDPAYISRLETGLITPPTDSEKLAGLATALEIKEGTPEWVIFFDLAYASNYQVPQDIKNDFPLIVNFLPAFYRTIRKKEMNSEDIQKLLSLLTTDASKE
jgi:transcriptional regulator with XRE-family HTH domain